MRAECTLHTRRDTQRLARAAAAHLRPGALLLLDGPLGAGKTFLARCVARALGVDAAVQVPSPTYNLLLEYPIASGALLHADLYRLRDGNMALELERLELRARRADGAIVIVEWATGFEHLFGSEADLQLQIARNTDGVRQVDLGGRLAAEVAHDCLRKP